MINYGFLVNKKANEADITEWWKKNEEWQMIIIKLIHILLVYKVLNLLNFLLFEGYGITP